MSMTTETNGPSGQPVADLINNHLGLAHWAARELGYTLNDPHEALSLCLNALHRAALRWNGSSPFAGYARTMMQWLINGARAKARAMKRGGGLIIHSLNQLHEDVGFDPPDPETFEDRGHSADTGLRELMRQSLAGLSDRHRLILTARFGLNGQPPESRPQIGERLQISREGIRHIEIDALAALASAMKAKAPHLSSPAISRAVAFRCKAATGRAARRAITRNRKAA